MVLTAAVTGFICLTYFKDQSQQPQLRQDGKWVIITKVNRLGGGVQREERDPKFPSRSTTEKQYLVLYTVVR